MTASEYAAFRADQVNKLIGQPLFRDACAFAQVEPTRRQARKFLRGYGRASEATRNPEFKRQHST